MFLVQLSAFLSLAATHSSIVYISPWHVSEPPDVVLNFLSLVPRYCRCLCLRSLYPLFLTLILLILHLGFQATFALFFALVDALGAYWE